MSEKIPTYLFEDEDPAIERITKIIMNSEHLTLAGQAKSLKAALRLTDTAANAQEALFLLDGSLISPNKSGQDGEIIKAQIEAIGPTFGWVIFSISSRSIPGVEVQLGKLFNEATLDSLVRDRFKRS